MSVKNTKSIIIRLVLVLVFVAGVLKVVPVRAREDHSLLLPGATGYVATMGNDLSDCATPSTPCATINGAIAKAATSGDTIKVAIGTYTGSGEEVVLVNKSVALSGGWDSTFTTQDGISIIDGQTSRRAINVDLDVTVLIERFSIQNGSWMSSGNGGGGGIYNLGNLTLNNSEVTNNSAVGGGGGIANLGILTVNNGTIRNNTTQGYIHVGGGISNGMYNPGSGILTLNGTTVSGNSSIIGGGIYNTQTTILNNSTISGNSATGGGGGIATGGGTVTAGSLTINNSTVTNNSIPYGYGGEGGGIYHSAGNINVRNSIIAQNSANLEWGGPDCFSNRLEPSVIINSIGYNLIGNNSKCRISSATGDIIGTGTNPILPGLTSLQNNGGSTFTHALMEDSPAIEAGNPAAPGSGGNACLGTDQRGVTRPQGHRCDIGAYEFEVEAETTPPTVISIVRANANATSAASVNFTVTFSERVFNVNANDFTLHVTGSITGANVGSVTGSGSTRMVTVNTGSGNGTLGLTVPISATITDLAGNPITGLPFTVGETYTLLKEATFSDMSIVHWAWQYVERLYNAGITGGCGNNNYCPEGTVTRAQMAVFLERGMRGSSYAPPAVGGSTGFGDVDPTHWAAAWIKQLAADGITGGCGSGNYCPESPVTRAQMAVFLLKAKYGKSYTPPAVGASTGFGDVATNHWAGVWIKQLAAEGITGGCGSGNYCPESSVTRAQMAVFLVKTFSLP